MKLHIWKLFPIILLLLSIMVLGVQLYHTGLPRVRSKAEIALLRAIDDDLEKRLKESKIPYICSNKQIRGTNVRLTNEKGVHEVANDTFRVNSSFSFEKMAKQTILKEKFPIHADSLNRLWHKSLDLMQIKGQTAIRISVLSGQAFSSPTRHFEEGIIPFVTYRAGLANEITIESFFEPVGWMVPFYGDWEDRSVVFILVFITVLILFIFRSLFINVLPALVKPFKRKATPLYSYFETRIYGIGDNRYYLGTMLFDYENRTLKNGRTVYELRPQVADLLLLFLNAPDHVLLDEDIKKALWLSRGEVATNDRKNRTISDLRKAFNEVHPLCQLNKLTKDSYQLVLNDSEK